MMPAFQTFIDRLHGAAGASELRGAMRSEEHTSELQSRRELVCRPLLEKKNSDASASRALPWTPSSVRLKTTFGSAHHTSANAARSSSSRIEGSVSHTSIVSYSLRPSR